MKPVCLEDVDALIENNSFMLLNPNLLGIRYISQFIAFESGIVTTKGTITLPAKLWERILSYALVDTPKSFSFVQAVSMRDSSTSKILRCRKMHLLRSSLCGESFDSSDAVFAFEEFMKTPDNKDTPRPSTVSTIEPCNHQHHESAFDILMTATDTNLPVTAPCLFSDITVPDIIACKEGGSCWLCGSGRDICPGCTRGIAQQFDVFLGCGVSLACPLCLGVDFSRKHKDFLNKYYWTDPPEEEKKAIDDWFQKRLDEFGY